MCLLPATNIGDVMMSRRTKTSAELKMAIGGVESFLEEAKRELKNQEFRERLQSHSEGAFFVVF